MRKKSEASRKARRLNDESDLSIIWATSVDPIELAAAGVNVVVETPGGDGQLEAGGGVVEEEAGDNVVEEETGDNVVEEEAGGDDVEDEIEEEREAVEDDDCEVEEEEFPIAEENCEDIGSQFGLHEQDEDDGTDADSGDDVWDDDRIPEPLERDSEAEDDAEDEDDEPGSDRVQRDDDEVYLKLGKCFSSKEDFKIAVFRYSLKSRYDIKLYRSQETKIGAKCNDKEEKCQWRCYASYDKKKQKIQIKVFVPEHTCVRSGYTSLLKQGTIAWLFKERLRKNPKITKYEMAEEIKREYNLIATEERCGKAKTQVTRQWKQSHEDHFSRIWDYQAEILKSNPESTCEIETVPGTTIGSKQRFYRMFMCFKAQRDSWKKTCRPILGLDGAFLKWDIRGHLLAAVGRDGDNRIVPVAWAVVEIENDDNWDWFVRLLASTLRLGEGSNYAIISDKQKGLIKAVHNVLPQAEHRQCARHILDNWKRDTHDLELQRLFWKIARSYTQGEFGKYMDELQRYSPTSYASLLVTLPATWSRAFFRLGTCCNDILNNLSESFNRTIKQARKKPLLELLEDIRRQAMVRNAKRYVIAERLQTRFTARAHAEIEKMIAGSQFCTRYMSRNNLHEIDVEGEKYRVDMNDFTCGCKKWQMTGIPCIHGARVIIGMKEKVEDYVVDYYTTKTWRLTYEDGIAPVQGQLLWPRMNRLGVLPPPWRNGKRGRRSNYARKKGRNETSRLSRQNRVITCSNCKQDGHNKKTCKNARVKNQPIRARGRPRKEQGQSSQGQQSHVQSSQGQSSQVESSQGNASQGQASQVQASQVQSSRRQVSRRQSSRLLRQASEAQTGSFWAPWFECSNPQPQ